MTWMYWRNLPHVREFQSNMFLWGFALCLDLHWEVEQERTAGLTSLALLNGRIESFTYKEQEESSSEAAGFQSICRDSVTMDCAFAEQSYRSHLWLREGIKDLWGHVSCIRPCRFIQQTRQKPCRSNISCGFLKKCTSLPWVSLTSLANIGSYSMY